MIQIEHIALWVVDIERSRDFYETVFNGRASIRYHNPTKGFTSYFLSFNESGARLELMHNHERAAVPPDPESRGYAHMAFNIGSVDTVLSKTEDLRKAGFRIIGEPRWTGDGYFESVVSDPDGNWIELTAGSEPVPPDCR